MQYHDFGKQLLCYQVYGQAGHVVFVILSFHLSSVHLSTLQLHIPKFKKKSSRYFYQTSYYKDTHWWEQFNSVIIFWPWPFLWPWPHHLFYFQETSDTWTLSNFNTDTFICRWEQLNWVIIFIIRILKSPKHIMYHVDTWYIIDLKSLLCPSNWKYRRFNEKKPHLLVPSLKSKLKKKLTSNNFNHCLCILYHQTYKSKN